jgi:hypothetical protein
MKTLCISVSILLQSRQTLSDRLSKQSLPCYTG